jgi:hypothetical protein
MRIESLDDWLTENLPPQDYSGMAGRSTKADSTEFYIKCFTLTSDLFDDTVDQFMVNALHDSMFGSNILFSYLLTEKELSKTKLKTIGWVLCNPQTLKLKRRNVSARTLHLLRTAALLHGWCELDKTLAIETAIRNFLNASDMNVKEQEFDVLRNDVFRALRKPLYKKIFEQIVYNKKREVEALPGSKK